MRRRPRPGRLPILALVLLFVLWGATTASAQITGSTPVPGVTPATPPGGLPRSYTAIPVDTPNPIPGGAFGWGLASADLTGSGHADLLVPQSQTGPGQIFEFDGLTGNLIRTINPPESNLDNTSPTFAFVYVATIPDIGSCPGGQVDQICPNPTIGPPDGIPDIVAGSRALQVPATDGAAPSPSDLHIGRLYIFDGATGAILKRIDMPQADRQLEYSLSSGTVAAAPYFLIANSVAPQFGRIGIAPQGMAPCAGLNSENNAVGIGPCPSTPTAVRIGSVDNTGYPSIIVTARSFIETGGPGGSAAPGSQCANATVPATPTKANPAPTCVAGRAWVYSGAAIAGSDPRAIDDTPLYTIKNPDAQLANTEFGGNVYPVGDVCGGGSSSTTPDGIPDFVIANRNAGYPLLNPDPAYPAVGNGFLYNGATGKLCPSGTIPDPEPQPKAQFSGSFNIIRATGDLGASTISDFILPSALQNMYSTDDGAAFVFNGDENAGGGGEGSWHFATLTDPNPHIGGNFGGSFTGVGDIVPSQPANEVMIGSFSPFDPSTAATNANINNLFIFNAQTQTLLQTIPDPDQSPGSGFGVGVVPMGDLNGDGFLDYAASSYLWNGSVAGQGRAYIIMSDNSPAPTSPVTTVPGPGTTPIIPPTKISYKKGACANVILGTKGRQNLYAPMVGRAYGFKIFGGRGTDTIHGGEGVDCLHGGRGSDLIMAGLGNTTIIGGRGKDVIRGGPGHDKLYAGQGNDELFAGSGKTLLVGAKRWRDLIVGGRGHDRFYGNGGSNMIIVGRSGGNYVDTGSGNNVVDVRNGKRSNTVVCGTGRNVIVANRGDRLVNCQVVLYTLRPRAPLPRYVLLDLWRLRRTLHVLHPTIQANG